MRSTHFRPRRINPPDSTLEIYLIPVRAAYLARAGERQCRELKGASECGPTFIAVNDPEEFAVLGRLCNGRLVRDLRGHQRATKY